MTRRGQAGPDCDKLLMPPKGDPQEKKDAVGSGREKGPQMLTSGPNPLAEGGRRGCCTERRVG